ncbi:hypothetical protein BDZ45DRAFT_748273 [Acephala macrosclerotiorum]|nr:hypothetical protein BDZ45DRAFT_748273 [Acephala macrosclerotiorum]
MAPTLLRAVLLILEVMTIRLPLRDSFVADASEVQIRSDGDTCCAPTFTVGSKTLTQVDRSDVLAGINYLKDTTSVTGNSANNCLTPKEGCSRVSCYGNAAFYACNNNDPATGADINIGCGVFSSAASDLATLCSGPNMCGQIYPHGIVEGVDFSFYLYITYEKCDLPPT